MYVYVYFIYCLSNAYDVSIAYDVYCNTSLIVIFGTFNAW